MIFVFVAVFGLILFLNWYNEPLRTIRRENQSIAREDAVLRWENTRILRERC